LGRNWPGRHLLATTLDLASLRLALHLDDELDTPKFTKRFYG
jgi:hypothetical protein